MRKSRVLKSNFIRNRIVFPNVNSYPTNTRLRQIWNKHLQSTQSMHSRSVRFMAHCSGEWVDGCDWWEWWVGWWLIQLSLNTMLRFLNDYPKINKMKQSRFKIRIFSDFFWHLLNHFEKSRFRWTVHCWERKEWIFSRWIWKSSGVALLGFADPSRCYAIHHWTIFSTFPSENCKFFMCFNESKTFRFRRAPNCIVFDRIVFFSNFSLFYCE